jgi:hypothetical protein
MAPSPFRQTRSRIAHPDQHCRSRCSCCGAKGLIASERRCPEPRSPRGCRRRATTTRAKTRRSRRARSTFFGPRHTPGPPAAPGSLRAGVDATAVAAPPIVRPTSTQSRSRSESTPKSLGPDRDRAITRRATRLAPGANTLPPNRGGASTQSRSCLHPFADSLTPIRALASTHLRSHAYPFAIALSPNIEIARAIWRSCNSLSA